LDGAQSALFFQAIRIIKEMRCKTNGKYPRWICWENVFGVFSSSKGRDFQRVLEEIIGVVVPNATVPAPDDYRWPYADVYVGDGWSVAYRTLDSQWYGVAQRRRRCYLSQILEVNVPATYYLSAKACLVFCAGLRHVGKSCRRY
jgi:DNA (cytosine-5)-methyltransferase 1